MELNIRLLVLRNAFFYPYSYAKPIDLFCISRFLMLIKKIECRLTNCAVLRVMSLLMCYFRILQSYAYSRPNLAIMPCAIFMPSRFFWHSSIAPMLQSARLP